MAANRHILVVGASLAGLRGCEALRREGFDGRLTLLGAESHEPYDRPPLSKQLLAGRMEPADVALRREPWDELALELRLGVRAERLDPHAREVSLAGGERVAYDGLLIATGATPRTLRGVAPLEGLHVLRSLDDALAIRRALEKGPRVVIVGGGFIGAEVAATCRSLDLDVTLVEALSQPCVRGLGETLGGVVANLHRDHGVDLRLGVGVQAIEGAGRVERVRLDDGSSLAADLVVVGIGVVPEVGWLEGSGLTLRDGVVCDATCAAGPPGVVAAGDVARWHNPRFGEAMRVEHWTHAVEQAEACARQLLGAGEPFAPVPYVWSDQYDRKLQIAGRVGDGDELRVVQGSFEERRFVAIAGRGGRLSGVVGMNRPAPVMRWKRQIADGISWDEALAAAEA
jgi:NADPH-dependent 2,4-dienoyl-CoA reductase/sulfur reductase-like enzyme